MANDEVAGYRDVVTGERDGPAPDGAAQVAPTAAPELRSLLSIAVGTLVIAALYFGQEVLIPITLAVMLSFVLSPVVTLLQRLRLPRAPAVILAVLAALGVLGLIGLLIGSQAAALTANAPQYAQTVEAQVQGVRSYALGKAAALSAEFGAHKPAPAATPRAAPALPRAGAPAPATAAAPRPVPVQVVDSGTTPLSVAKAVLAPILGPLETTILVLIVAIFVLMQREDLRDRFIRLFGSNDLHRTTRAMNDAGQRLSRYFLSQAAVNSCFGVVIGLGLWAIGIPSPAMWGLMAGLLRFVPYIGSLIAAVAPAALGAAVDPGWGMAIEVVALFFVVEPLTGYVVEPLLYGHSTGLSPVSVIVSAIFWTWVWGPIGLILSTPLTLCLVVMGRHVKSLEFFDVLLGDRPALTPVESFYQRILADHPDEALAQAEALLADRPLGAYYDEVALQGLRLAAEDQARGTVDRPRAERMSRSMLAVVEDLAGHARPAADAAAPAGTVLCVAGRGPFDDAVAVMLGQLLAEQGVATRRLRHGQVSREAIAGADLAGAAVIAVSCLQPAGSPAELRYLVRRLRQHAPGARVVVGLWSAEDGAADAARTVGADREAGSLRDGVTAVLAELGAPPVAAAA